MLRTIALIITAGWLLLAGSTTVRAQLEPDIMPARYSRPFDAPAGNARGDGEQSSEDEIETDRDSFTPATSVVGRNRLVVESAWSYIDNRSVADTHSLPELIGRYGVTDWLELRLGFNYEAGGASNSISGDSGEDLPTDPHRFERDSQISYGLKAALTSQRGWRPQSSFIVQAGTPTSGRDTATQVFATYAAGWTFANRWKWSSAIRYGYDTFAEEQVNVWAPSTVLQIPLGERWKVHGEYFTILRSGGATKNEQHYFSPGVHYLVTPNLEIGTRLGWGLSDDSAAFFTNTGLGWRF